MSAGQPRKKFQYSLRGLAIVLTALIVWLGFHCNSAHRQATARRTILEQDGQAIMDYQITGTAQPWVPAGLRSILGEDLFGTVVRLNFNNGVLQDEGECLSALDGLPRVTVINIEGSSVGDAALGHIGRADLESLRLINAGIADQGLRHLANLHRLNLLDLSDNPITDAGLELLAGLDRLEYLTLKGTSVTDAGIQRLAGLSGLKYVNVQNTSVTASGVAALQRSLLSCQIVHD